MNLKIKVRFIYKIIPNFQKLEKLYLEKKFNIYILNLKINFFL